jgi:hypothetical protein
MNLLIPTPREWNILEVALRYLKNKNEELNFLNEYDKKALNGLLINIDERKEEQK